MLRRNSRHRRDATRANAVAQLAPRMRTSAGDLTSAKNALAVVSTSPAVGSIVLPNWVHTKETAMLKRFILLMLSVGGCFGCGAEGAEPTEQDTFDIVHGNGHDYVFVQTPQTWSTARTKCGQYVGHLATIGDSGENDFIRDQAQQLFWGAWWIGRNDMTTENSWVWDKNELLQYDNWAPGEPNNWNEEDCATLDASNNGLWNDLNCNTSLNFVCERDSGAAPPYKTVAFSAANTNTATQNYSVIYFSGYASTVVTVGTCGVPGASNTGDTYLRIFDPTNTYEIMHADDACGGVGTNISFVPPVSGNFALRAGCWGTGSCSGTIAVRSPG